MLICEKTSGGYPSSWIISSCVPLVPYNTFLGIFGNFSFWRAPGRTKWWSQGTSIQDTELTVSSIFGFRHVIGREGDYAGVRDGRGEKKSRKTR